MADKKDAYNAWLMMGRKGPRPGVPVPPVEPPPFPKMLPAIRSGLPMVVEPEAGAAAKRALAKRILLGVGGAGLAAGLVKGITSPWLGVLDPSETASNDVPSDEEAGLAQATTDPYPQPTASPSPTPAPTSAPAADQPAEATPSPTAGPKKPVLSIEALKALAKIKGLENAAGVGPTQASEQAPTATPTVTPATPQGLPGDLEKAAEQRFQEGQLLRERLKRGFTKPSSSERR